MRRAVETSKCMVEYKTRLLDDSKIRWDRHEARAWNGRRTKLDDAYIYYKTITSKTITR